MKKGRIEYWTKDGIYVSYTDNDIAFEELATVSGILIKNDGTIVFNNFDAEKTKYFIEYFNRIFPTVVRLRTMERMGLI